MKILVLQYEMQQDGGFVMPSHFGGNVDIILPAGVNHIVIEKKTGRRLTEYDIPMSEIKKAIIKKEYPDLKEYKKSKKLRLCPTVFGYKKNTVIVCGEENTIVTFSPDDNFINKLKEYMND